MIKQYDDEIFAEKLYLKLPHVPADIIRHSEDSICETLDLMRFKTLKWLFADQETKHDCKWL